MIEAKVTCLTGQIHVLDLGLKLVKGMTVYMPEAKARASHDLQRAWRMKGVEIRYVQRARRRREGSGGSNPVFPAPSRMDAFAPVPDEEEDLVLDPEALAERVAELLRPLIRQEVERAVGPLASSLQQVLVQAVADSMPKVVQVAAPAAGAPVSRAPVAPVGTMDDDVPVFIPSTIRTDGMKSEIEVRSEQGDDAGLSSAAAALKAARKAKQE